MPSNPAFAALKALRNEFAARAALAKAADAADATKYTREIQPHAAPTMEQIREEMQRQALAKAPEQKMLQGFYRGYAGDYDAAKAGQDAGAVFVTPQRAAGEFYANKRAAQTGLDPHLEMILADPFAGRGYGHAIPTGPTNKKVDYTKARELKPTDVQDKTQLYAKGGAVQEEQKSGKHVRIARKAAGGAVMMKDGGAATGFFPQMKPRRSKQDREASKDVPVALGRGAVAGMLGAPGDIESLIRMLPGLDESRTFLPTSEDIERRLPLREASASPVGRAATGLGTLAGGAYTGPGAPIRAVGALPGALSHGAQEFAKASAGAAPHVIKTKGGNFIDESLDYFVNKLRKHDNPEKTISELREVWTPAELADKPHLTQRLQEHIAGLEPEVALNQWIQQKVRPYVKNQMGTPEDPIRKLIEQGVYHMPEESLHMMGFLPEEVAVARKKAGFPEEGMAVQRYAERGFPEAEEGAARAAEGWEAATDTMLNPRHRSEFSMHDRPWMQKLDPNAPIHDIPMYDSPRDLGFDHILDVLREDITSGRIRPEQLSKITMEQAVRRTHQYDLEMAKKMEQAGIAAREGLPVFKEYPEGFRWIELNRPGVFAAESESMGHSVRGYEPPKGHPDWTETSGELGSLGYGHGGWDAIKSGQAKVYSLVDPKGKPHVTIEVKSGRKIGDYEFPNDVRDELAEVYGSASRAEFEDAVKRAMAQREIPSQITQIKGKQNARPKDEYLPFVQDFVRTSGHEVAGDFSNTGLYKVDPESDIGKRLQAAGREIPRFVNDEELTRLTGEFPPEYAGGGSVKTGVKEGVDLLRRSLFGLKPSQEMAGRELVPVQRDLDRMQAELAKAPKIEQKTTTVTPSPTAPKIEETVKSVASTPVSRRTVLKSAASQAVQHAMPAHTFADLMKPAEVAKQVVQAATPSLVPLTMQGVIAKAAKLGLGEDDTIKMLNKYGFDEYDAMYAMPAMRHPYDFADLGEEGISRAGALGTLIGTDISKPMTMRGPLREIRRENPEMYNQLRQTAKDIVEYGFEP